MTVKAVDADPSKAIAAFGAGSRPFQVLVISYESLAAHASGLGPAACDLLVCDEAQRLTERAPSAPVPSIVYENWTGVDIMFHLDGRRRLQSLVYFGNS